MKTGSVGQVELGDRAQEDDQRGPGHAGDTLARQHQGEDEQQLLAEAACGRPADWATKIAASDR